MKKFTYITLAGTVFGTTFFAARRSGNEAVAALETKVASILGNALSGIEYKVTAIGYGDVTIEIENFDDTQAIELTKSIASIEEVVSGTTNKERSQFGLISTSTAVCNDSQDCNDVQVIFNIN